jgi:hypothetical protein
MSSDPDGDPEVASRLAHGPPHEVNGSIVDL